LLIREKEIVQLKQNAYNYLSMLSQVSKHLKTLTKYLRDIVAKTEDPVTIEQT